jgi:hypothetical protein
MPLRPSQHHDRRIGARRRVLVVVACALGVALASSALGPRARAVSAPPGSTFVLIANPTNVVATVERDFIARAFLRKLRWWPDGASIQPVDLPPSSPLRRRWSQEILFRSVEAVKNYWQQLIFAGRDLPPPEMESETDVVDYVLRTAGAVGYVSPGTNLRGARVLILK